MYGHKTIKKNWSSSGPLFHVFRVQKSKKRGITAGFDSPEPLSTPKNAVYDLKIEPGTQVWS